MKIILYLSFPLFGPQQHSVSPAQWPLRNLRRFTFLITCNLWHSIGWARDLLSAVIRTLKNVVMSDRKLCFIVAYCLLWQQIACLVSKVHGIWMHTHFLLCLPIGFLPSHTLQSILVGPTLMFVCVDYFLAFID